MARPPSSTACSSSPARSASAPCSPSASWIRNDQEKERGITILAKNTAITWRENRINIVDTPGHADFGGEVERVLSMVDSVLLLVDAMDGPMPQTRFVTQKAFQMGFRPIVVINKVDRPGARPDWVLNQTFDLFDRLGATNEQLDFPVVYASALHGYAGLDPDVRSGDMVPLYEAIMKHVHAPKVDPDGPFQMRISQLDYSSYVGLIGIGRIQRGKVRTNQPVAIVDREGKKRQGRVLQVLGFMGLERTRSAGGAGRRHRRDFRRRSTSASPTRSARSTRPKVCRS